MSLCQFPTGLMCSTYWLPPSLRLYSRVWRNLAAAGVLSQIIFMISTCTGVSFPLVFNTVLSNTPLSNEEGRPASPLIEYREAARVVKKIDGRFHDSQPEEPVFLTHRPGGGGRVGLTQIAQI